MHTPMWAMVVRRWLDGKSIFWKHVSALSRSRSVFEHHICALTFPTAASVSGRMDLTEGLTYDERRCIKEADGRKDFLCTTTSKVFPSRHYHLDRTRSVANTI